ncbi:hypothetical protein DYB36_010242, partial [Aphanomyces astaci]
MTYDSPAHIYGSHGTVPNRGHTERVGTLAWNSTVLASGSRYGDVCFRHALQAVDTGSQVCNLVWSKNSNEVVSTHGYSLNQIIVWKYPSMAKVATLTGHTYRVLYLAMSPNGQTIVTGAGDETLRFWNAFAPATSQTSSLVLPLAVQRHNKRHLPAAFSAEIDTFWYPKCLVVEGMRCQNKCARRIREALEDVPGVASADVRFQGKSATITFTSPQTSVSVVELIQAVRGLDAGLNKSYDAYLPGDDRRARTVVLHVDGMSCMMNCARKVESALATAAGVKSAKVDFDLKQATVVIEPGSRITEDDLINTVQGAGKKFVASVQVSSPRVVVPTSPVVPILPSLSSSTTPPTTKSHASISIKELPADSSSSRVTIAVSGMTCNSCANSVESALRATAGVESCVVNFATESASVKFIASTIGIRSLIEVVEGIGYGAAVATTSAVVQSDDNRQIDIATWRSTFVVALVFTFPILIVMMLLDNIAPISRGLRTQVFHINGSTWNDLVLFLLATPVQFYCGRRFHIDAWKGVRNRVLGMAFLVSMGTNAAYFFAVFSDLRCLYLGDASFSVPDMYMTSSTL